MKRYAMEIHPDKKNIRLHYTDAQWNPMGMGTSQGLGDDWNGADK